MPTVPCVAISSARKGTIGRNNVVTILPAPAASVSLVFVATGSPKASATTGFRRCRPSGSHRRSAGPAAQAAGDGAGVMRGVGRTPVPLSTQASRKSGRRRQRSDLVKKCKPVGHAPMLHELSTGETTDVHHIDGHRLSRARIEARCLAACPDRIALFHDRFYGQRQIPDAAPRILDLRFHRAASGSSRSRRAAPFIPACNGCRETRARRRCCR